VWPKKAECCLDDQPPNFSVDSLILAFGVLEKIVLQFAVRDPLYARVAHFATRFLSEQLAS
jgi:hypothetical protein